MHSTVTPGPRVDSRSTGEKHFFDHRYIDDQNFFSPHTKDLHFLSYALVVAMGLPYRDNPVVGAVREMASMK